MKWYRTLEFWVILWLIVLYSIITYFFLYAFFREVGI